MADRPEIHEPTKERALPDFHRSFHAVLVFSSQEYAQHVPMALKLIEEALAEPEALGFPLAAKRLSRDVAPRDHYKAKISELCETCVLGVVLLDGLRPNVVYELGLLDGLGQPTMVVISAAGRVAVKGYYPGDPTVRRTISGLPASQWKMLEEPKIDLRNHLSDLQGDHVVMLPDPLENEQSFKAGFREALLKMKAAILAGPKLSSAAAREEAAITTLLSAGKFGDALEKISRLLAVKPQDIGLYNNQGIALSQLERVDEAVNVFDAALRIKQDDVTTLVNKGIALSRADRDSDALNCFNKALEINPSDTMALYAKGIALIDEDEKQAMQLFEKAIDTNPRHVQSWTHKGVLLARLGRLDDALKSFEIALAIEPEDREAAFEKANALANTGRVAEALALVEGVAATKPSSSVLLRKARFLQMAGRKEDAVQALRLAVDIAKDKKKIYGRVAAVFDSLDMAPDALEYWKMASHASPSDDHFLFHYCSSLSENGKAEEALSLAERGLKLRPWSTHLVRARAESLSALGQHQEAAEAYAAAWALDGKDAHLLNLEAMQLIFAGKAAEAIPKARQAVSLEPDEWNARSTLAFALGQAGQTDEAMTLHSLAVQKLANSPEAWLELAATLRTAGRQAEAQDAMNKASGLPHHKEAFRQYASFLPVPAPVQSPSA